jgi:putative transposase
MPRMRAARVHRCVHGSLAKFDNTQRRAHTRAMWSGFRAPARLARIAVAGSGVRFLIRDRDSKYSGPFDEVFRSEGIRIVKTPFRAPKANAIAERFVRTARSECLDWLLILNRRHLEHVLRIYVNHYNRERPHRSLDLKAPIPEVSVLGNSGTVADVHRRDRVGGLIPRVLPSRRMSCDTDIGALHGQKERLGSNCL